MKTHISARAHLIAGAILICLVAALRAQSASPQAPPPTFRAGTALVQVDVVVRDGKGNFVDNLNKGDFRILEDGKPQTVETFTLVGAPGTAARAAQRGSAATQPAGLPSVVRPPTRPMFIFVFDDEHIEPGGFKNVQKAAEDFLQSHFTGNAIGGVVSSRGMANNRLTSSRDELLKDIQGLKPRGSMLAQKYDLREWPRLLSLEEADQIANGNTEVLSAAVLRAQREEPQGRHADDPTGAVLAKARQLTTEAAPATQRLLSTLAVLMNGLSKFEGPKSVIFLSGGFFTDESWPALQQVVGLAARAHARIYSIDARGLNFANLADPTAPTSNAQGDELGELLTDADRGSDGPNSLAVDTGGFAIRHTNNFAQALDQIADDSTTYYLVGYRPTNTNFDGKFRKISVKVDRPGVTVRARRGYLAVPPPATTISTTAPATPPEPAAPAAPGTPTVPPAPSTAPAPGVPPGPAAPSTPAAPVGPGSTTAAAPAPETTHLRPEGLEHTEQLRDRPGKALSDAKSAVPLSPAGTEASQEAVDAWSQYQRGNLEGAEHSFAIAAADDSAHPWVHYAYGLTEYGLRKFPRAITQWEQVRQSTPEFEPVYFDLADGYMQSGDRQHAVKILRQAQARWPKDAEVYNALGVIQVTMGVMDEAVKSFQRAVAVAPDSGLGYFNLGKALELRYFKSQRYVPGTGARTANDQDRQQAIAAYQKYLKIGGPFAQSADAELQRLEYELKPGPRG